MDISRPLSGASSEVPFPSAPSVLSQSSSTDGERADRPIDMPGVGAVAARDLPPIHRGPAPVPFEIAPTLRAELDRERREELLSQLLFGARDLAQKEILNWRGFGLQCLECRGTREDHDASIRHKASCRTGRVLRVIDELCSLADDGQPSPQIPVPPAAGSSENYGEPWKADGSKWDPSVRNSDGRQIVFCGYQNLALAHRVALCVNVLAKVPSSALEEILAARAIVVKGGTQ